MTTNWILYPCLALSALALASSSQQPPAARKLTRVPAQDLRQDPAAAEEWKQKLSQTDLEKREGAYAELVERARTDDELRGALERWAKSADAGELAWTARLALRELRASGPGDLRRRFEQLEHDFGGMDSLFEDLNSRFQGFDLHYAPFPHGLPQTPGTGQQSRSYSLQVGPDGVALETTEDVDGNKQTRTYKAKDMQELLRDHPELRDMIGGGEHFDLRGAPGQNWFSLRNGQPQSDWLRSPRPSGQPPTDVLGIYSQKLTPEQAQELELEAEQGLRVERVEPGTIAQVLGIRRGDTLVELNGKPIYGAEDVRAVLQSRKPDEGLAVTLIGEGSKERRTLRWSPAEPQPKTDVQPRKL
jgi:hypothetical protein